MKIKLLMIVLLIVTSIIADAKRTRVDITDWSIVYTPGNEVSILIHDPGLNINMVFWRGKLPLDQIVYDHNNNLKVYYSIDDFSNVLEMLNTITYLSFIYTSDTGFGESAYLAKF